MNPGRKRSFPRYRTLLLENKIFLFLLLIVPPLAVVAVFAQHWAASRAVERMLGDRHKVVLGLLSEAISQAATGDDQQRLSSLLERASRLDGTIAYIIVSDTSGRSLAATSGFPRSWERGQVLDATESIEADYLETVMPLQTSGQSAGTLTIGAERQHVRRIADGIVMVSTAITAPALLILLLLVWVLVRGAVRPLKELTRVADEISTGNLDPRIDFGVHVNCWEIKNCQRPDCKAYLNMSTQCWYLDGTPCEGYEPRFPQKLQGCRTCEVYQTHRGDEIVQLADSFRHMADVLKDSREELLKSDDFQRRLIRNSFDGIVATDAEGTITIFNRVAEGLTGLRNDQVVGSLNWRSLFDEGLEKMMDLPLSYERFRRVRGFRPRESFLKRGDGTLIDVLLAGISLYEKGLHIGNVFFFQDVREIKKLREELIRSERLAATGQAAAGISHSIRNILDGLRGGVYVFKQGKSRHDGEKMETGWEMIERNVDIISALVRDLLNFAKTRKPDYREVVPAALIEDLLSRLNLSRQQRIQVHASIDEETGTVRLDPAMFEQCLVNLIRNAMEAIPEERDGSVTVGFKREGERAIFTVSDNGVGMNSETVEKVKGGMFSTKGSKGTGLGLLVIQKIVAEHGGTLTIETEEGKGSTFRIDIPADAKSAQQ